MNHVFCLVNPVCDMAIHIQGEYIHETGKIRIEWRIILLVPRIQHAGLGPNLEPGTVRVYVIHGSQNGLNIGRTVGPCTITRRRWVLGSVGLTRPRAAA